MYCNNQYDDSGEITSSGDFIPVLHTEKDGLFASSTSIVLSCVHVGDFRSIKCCIFIILLYSEDSQDESWWDEDAF